MATRDPHGSRRTRGAGRRASPSSAEALVRTSGSTPRPVERFQTALERLFERPDLLQAVPHLAPEILHQVIRHAGLDAAVDLVALATPEQLTSVLDLDLWRPPQAGSRDEFDADRFGEWIETLVDASADEAARIVASLDHELVIAGLSKYIRVFDPETRIAAVSTDDEPVVDAGTRLEDGEIGGYLLRPRRPDGWDTIVSLLVSLESGFRDTFHAVMRGCRRLSNSAPEIDGLDNLLTEPEQHDYDVAIGRDDRRSRVGYVTTDDARAFLRMARERRSPQDDLLAMNPIVAAYVRGIEESVAPVAPIDAGARAELGAGEETSSAPGAAPADVLVEWLAEAGVLPERSRAPLELTGAPAARTHETRMQSAMRELHDTDERAYVARSGELAFLTNALMTGCSVQSRPFTPREASEAAVAVCNLGLEHWPARSPGVHAGEVAPIDEAFLARHDLIAVFAVGWATLYEEVSIFVTDRLIATLVDVQCVDQDVQRGLVALKRELVAGRAAGTPWRARDALDALATLDLPAWASLLGLLDECPVLPAALIAIIERHSDAVSATAFEFISTTGQIERIRTFMAALPDILSG